MKLSRLKSSINRSTSVLTYDHGRKIAGTIKRNGVASPNVVKLYERSTGQLVLIKASDKHGNYSFTNLPNMKFTVIATDATNEYNAVIQDNVVPK